MLSSSVNDTVTSAFSSVLPESAFTGSLLPSSATVGCVGAVVSTATVLVVAVTSVPERSAVLPAASSTVVLFRVIAFVPTVMPSVSSVSPDWTVYSKVNTPPVELARPVWRVVPPTSISRVASVPLTTAPLSSSVTVATILSPATKVSVLA